MDDGDGDGGGDASALTMMDDPATDEDERGLVTKNTDGIAANKESLGEVRRDLYGEDPTSSAHGDASACAAVAGGGGGLLDRANCNEARSSHNADDIKVLNTDFGELDDRVVENEDLLVEHGEKLVQKKMYIDNLAAEIGVDPVTGMGTGEGGKSRIDMNEDRSMDNATAIGENKMAIESNDMDIAANVTAIGANKTAIESNDMDIAANSAAIVAEATTRGEMDMMLGGRITANTTAIETEMTERMNADAMLDTAIKGEAMMRSAADTGLSDRIDSNAGAIATNMSSIGSNASAIGDNRNMIGELSDDLDVVRAGVAASMALAGMPAINGRGISIGVGSFDGESAFAVGFQIQGEQASFKVGVTSSGGATGASAGVGFNF